MTRLEVFPIEGIPEVREGDDLAGLIAAAEPGLHDGDVVVVTQKVVSKAEGAMAPIDPDDPRGHKAIVEDAVGADHPPARRPHHQRDQARLRVRQRRRRPVERRRGLGRPAPGRQRPLGPADPRRPARRRWASRWP